MAIVSSAPILHQRVHSPGVVTRLMGSRRRGGGEITEEEEMSAVVEVEEEKIYVAVGTDVKESKSTLLWALQNFPGKKICLLHVHQPAKMIRTVLGGKMYASMLPEQEVRAYRRREEQDMHKLLNDYLNICAQNEVVGAEKQYIEMDNIEKGIVEFVALHGITKLVMGAAADRHKKKLTTPKSKKAIFVSQQARISCHIWFVCGGRVIQTREGSFHGLEVGINEPPFASPFNGSSREDHIRSMTVTEGQSNQGRLASPVQQSFSRISSQGRRVATVPPLHGSNGSLISPRQLPAEDSVTECGDIAGESYLQGLVVSTGSSIDESISSVRDYGSEDESILSSIPGSGQDIRHSSPTSELDEGRSDRDIFDQLLQARDEADISKREAHEEFVKCRKAERNAIEAMRKAKESESLYTNEVKQRKDMELILAKETLELNKIKGQHDEVMEELRAALDQKMTLESKVADFSLILQELEGKIVFAVDLLVTVKEERDTLKLERDNAIKEAEELRKGKEEETSSQRRYFFSEFSFSEIDEATRSFDPCLIIGEGGYGTVYKGFLRNTEVAIKLLDSSSLQGATEFQQEVDVLSRMRHPNLLTLVGTCPEAWSLIYEYLPNGSLEDRLACKDDTQPLSWQTRIHIAVEICSALIFLHHNKPHGIIHGDLKPSNVLLDANFVSKLGDFGMCRSLAGSESVTDSTTLFCRTNNPKGTLVYMDPEFLSTGELTPKSDVYSFGILLLQILTGKPAFGITKEVQSALDQETLGTLLDSSAGDWPFVQAKQIAYLALRCCEMNRKNRPSLISDVWRILEPMKAACRASSSSFSPESEDRHIPSYFICPIFQEIMSDPQVAADGFTYEAEAIKGWLEGGHDTSPMTNLKLAHCNLIPNHSLRSATEEWKQQHI